jgi:DNA-binding response OmpR family regulator
VTRGARILLAVDDRANGATLTDALADVHGDLRVCVGMEGAPSQVAIFRPDLVILDMQAREAGALAIIVRRTHAVYRPLVLCALHDGAAQRIAALEAGADACIQWPFEARELELHVRALLRRASWLAHSVHQIGELVIDVDSHVALYDDELLELTAKDFAVLAMLAQHAGSVVTKRSLLEGVWGYEAYDENLVEVHVSALRRRLPPPARHLVHTVRGLGYVLREDVPQATWS